LTELRDAAATGSAPTGLRAHLASPLYRNAYFLIIGAGAGALLGFVFWSVAARRYSAEFVGLNSVLISAMMIASGICQLGLNAVLYRYLPGAGRSTRAMILRTYGVTSALAAVVGLGTALCSSLWAPDSGFLHESPGWVLAFVVATVAWTVFSLQDSVLTGLRQSRWVPLENSIFSAIKVVLLFAFVGSRGGIFLAWSVPALLALAPVNLLILRRLVPRHLESGYETSLDRSTVLRLAAGNYVGTLFVMASTTLLPIVVAAEVGSRDTAYFYIPWSIATGIQLVALNMTTSLTVEVAYDGSKLRAYCRSVTLQTMRLVTPVVVILTLGAHYVLLVFGGAYARNGATCLRLLALATIPNVIVMLGLSVARIQHQARMVVLVPGVAGALTIALSLVLLPRIGIDGVGWAWLAGQAAVAAWLLAGYLRPVFFTPARA
jgi:O-antigen/teichoic acid export membrane protein